MGKVEEWGREGREGVKEGCREEGRGREGRRVVGVEGRLQKQGSSQSSPRAEGLK